MRRGVSLARNEPTMIAELVAKGCQPLGFSEAEQVVQAHVRQAVLVRGSENR